MSKATYLTVLTAFFLVPILACSPGAASGGANQKLTVFAASSLTQAFQEIATIFERENPGVTITFNFAGSQQLRTQLVHGAQADVFASADRVQMDAVVDAGLAGGDPVSPVSNSLVVIAFAQNQEVASLRDLARPRAKVVVAQPEVPAGAYARTVIGALASSPHYGPEYAEQVMGNVVSEETNVRNVAQKVALGEADAGIVYRTDALVADIAQRTGIIPIPGQFNVKATYPTVPLVGSSQPDIARRFIDFALSDRGQQVFSRYGFSPASSARSEEAHRDPTGFDGQ